jgi:hypothetical protein
MMIGPCVPFHEQLDEVASGFSRLARRGNEAWRDDGEEPQRRQREKTRRI